MASHPVLDLNGFAYPDLSHAEGLARLDGLFLGQLQQNAPHLHKQLIAYREHKNALGNIETSILLINCAVFLEQFLSTLFSIEEEVEKNQARSLSYAPIAAFKKYFVLRRAKKELTRIASFPPFSELEFWLSSQLQKAPLATDDEELAVALLAGQFLASPEQFKDEIEKLVQWCVHALASSEGQKRTQGWTSFWVPQRLDHAYLVETVRDESGACSRLVGPNPSRRLRDGFGLTDPRMNEREIYDHVHYCIYCHDHEGDFCSKGFPVKKGDPSQGFKKSPHGTTLSGCPLEEKVSEMQYLKNKGHVLAAFAVLMIDNPMCPATGHRICNDCMKSCIYQKQEPVNVPQVETRVLTDVLDLPWGTELYELLTKWNPLRQAQWAMKPYNGLKVMIAGMGPAGFTLAHHLLMEGFAVVGFDGLKIEALPEALVKAPIYRFDDLKEPLDGRLMAGFGGVAEYGITVRWDKNFLKLIYLALMRRPYFQVFGGVRFGGTITIEDAWEMGFDHLAVAVGAGLPKALPVPGSLAPGMRQANDFLMALQLGNAAKKNSLNDLQVRLPAVVIGGGLTGTDAATELQAYYIIQVEKMLLRYEELVKGRGDSYLREQFGALPYGTLAEFLAHGKAIRAERERAKKNNTAPNFVPLIHQWGGVTIVYRRSMQESPAYINNHEELKKALEEGIFYAEHLEPVAVERDQQGLVNALVCHRRLPIKPSHEGTMEQQEIRLPARSILVATGTQPNIAYEFEHRGTFNRLDLQYQHYEEKDGKLVVAHGVAHCKDPQFGPFTSYHKGPFRVSLIGDTHPVFHGSVVKAIASGLRAYPKICKSLTEKLGKRGDETEYREFADRMDTLFRSQVTRVVRKTAGTIELDIHAPLAAKHFRPGQFYRLQNFTALALDLDHTLLQIEPLALMPAKVDKLRGTLSFIVIEDQANTKLCSTLRPGEWVSLMGPTGVRAKIPHESETVLIIGKQNSFSFVKCYGSALKESGNRVMYVCQLPEKEKLYCQEEIEEATDHIIWLTEKGAPIVPHRERDYSFTNQGPIAALHAYAREVKSHWLGDIDRIFVMGDANMLRQFQAARYSSLKPFFLKSPKAFGSVYGHMQCMLKGVCAQCLQWQIDPETGQRTKAVFACSWQDQPLEIIDIDHMEDRLKQNHVFSKLNTLWVDYVLERHDVTRV